MTISLATVTKASFARITALVNVASASATPAGLDRPATVDPPMIPVLHRELQMVFSARAM